ncbi:MAG: hypothetical protein E6R13_01620 [Spirochaetes bacterium]|nr:MAG: hypothetical protein E6R13_01620 [Spirochaetota bacterium]
MLASAALESLRRRTSLPNSQELFSDNDLIGFFNDENQSTITPFINKTREEYFTTHKDFSVTPGNSMFSIPSRAF